ncbi:MAG: hypothetical protein WKF73_04600 [Nocardioidaceae bacterium]
MTDRIHVTMNVDLFVEDEKAMRDAAFQRMREAWSAEDDFPYDSAGDVPLGQVIHSLLADALPAELTGLPPQPARGRVRLRRLRRLRLLVRQRW